MFEFSLEGILSIIAVLLCWSLAVVLFRVGTPGSVGRKLSALLIFEGITLGSSDSTLIIFASFHEWRDTYTALGTNQRIIHTLGDCGMIALYPPFLAAALRTRLTRPFAGRRGQLIALVYASALLVMFLGSSSFRVGGIWPAVILYLSMALLFLYAFVSAVHAWYVATGEARIKARIFTIAFGIRDVCWNIVYFMAMVGTIAQAAWLSGETASRLFILYPLGTLISVPLIAYGILRTQLFDIDLKIRWTIKQSTFALAVVAITFGVSEGVEMLVAAELGDTWGLLAAAVALLFLKPLQAFAERVVSLLMPNTENTEEYKAGRKLKVYTEAVAEAHAEGGISSKERALLVRLRDSLGVSEADAAAVEAELTGPTPQTA